MASGKTADDRLVTDVRDSPKAPFRERWKRVVATGNIIVILYVCVSSALVFKTEFGKQRYDVYIGSVEGQASCSTERYL